MQPDWVAIHIFMNRRDGWSIWAQLKEFTTLVKFPKMGLIFHSKDKLAHFSNRDWHVLSDLWCQDKGGCMSELLTGCISSIISSLWGRSRGFCIYRSSSMGYHGWPLQTGAMRSSIAFWNFVQLMTLPMSFHGGLHNMVCSTSSSFRHPSILHTGYLTYSISSNIRQDSKRSTSSGPKQVLFSRKIAGQSIQLNQSVQIWDSLSSVMLSNPARWDTLRVISLSRHHVQRSFMHRLNSWIPYYLLG